MRKLLLSLLALTFAMSVGAQDQYAEVIDLMTAYLEITDKLSTDIEESQGEQQVAEAFNRYADDMEIIMPQMNSMSEKFPELNDDTPEALQPVLDQMEVTMERMMMAMQKVMESGYSGDSLQEAFERIGGLITGF